MAADPTKSPTPESPTTARPLEMDDDDVQDASINADDSTTAKPAASAATSTASGDAVAAGPPAAASASASGAADDEAAAPPKPPRPLTEQQKKEQTLKEAFPTVDIIVIKAVLTASRGNIESAFHALLEMTDPNAIEQEPTPPPQPPRPVHQDPQLGTGAAVASGRLSPYSQMLADEEYARQLAQHYESEDGSYEARTSGGYGGERSRGGPPQPPRGQRQDTGLKPNEMWGDKEHSFLDDDLPVIRENLRKGFVETQTKFNNWFTGIKKKIDDEWNAGDEDEDGHQHGDGPGSRPQKGRAGYGRGGFGAAGGAGGYGRQQPPRRSGDYDADPELLSDDFAGIQLHGDGTPGRQNPNLFRPPPSTSPRPGSERKVNFRDQDETIDMYSASPKLPPKDGAGGPTSGNSVSPSAAAKTSKWQPLSSVDPTPIADNDPFSLGDSEDEKDATAAKGSVAATSANKVDSMTETKTSTSSTSPEDAERLRKAAAEAMADSLVEDKPKA